MIDFTQFEVITFDCYGTLIDWESGILSAMRPMLEERGVDLGDDELLEMYSQFESEAQKGKYVSYKKNLQTVVLKFAMKYDFIPLPAEGDAISDSIKNWLPFEDTVDALKTLKEHYKLAIISNIDDDLFEATAKHLDVEFDWVITAQQVQAYKPSIRNFTFAFDKMSVSAGKILHVAQSLYHDVAPAKSLGLKTVWVNRREGMTGTGATPHQDVKPDLEIGDLNELVWTMDL